MYVFGNIKNLYDNADIVKLILNIEFKNFNISSDQNDSNKIIKKNLNLGHRDSKCCIS